jgi:heparin binding hemagglutinin HbhA
MADKNQLEIDDLKAPLLAAVGAADLALERVNEIVAALRERAGDARADAEARVGESRARIREIQTDLPDQVGDIRGRLSSDELRKFAEGYADAAQTTYTKLIERGEQALERLRTQPALEEAASRVEVYTDQAVELTQEALGNVASQTRAVGERAAKLVGVELPKRTEDAAAPVKKAAEKAPAQKAPAKKAPAKKATVKADSKTPVKAEAKIPAKAPAKTAAKKAPAKKAPAKKVTQK